MLLDVIAILTGVAVATVVVAVYTSRQARRDALLLPPMPRPEPPRESPKPSHGRYWRCPKSGHRVAMKALFCPGCGEKRPERQA